MLSNFILLKDLHGTYVLSFPCCVFDNYFAHSFNSFFSAAFSAALYSFSSCIFSQGISAYFELIFINLSFSFNMLPAQSPWLSSFFSPCGNPFLSSPSEDYIPFQRNVSHSFSIIAQQVLSFVSFRIICN
jgi:hypothetical protein